MGDDKKTPAKTDKKRVLQAKVTAKAPAVKGKVAVKAKVPAVKGKVAVKAKVPAVKGKLGIKIGAKAPKAKVSIKPKVKVHLKAKLPSMKVKLHVKAASFKWKASADFENKVAPSEFLKGQACRPNFMAAYQMLYNVNYERSETQFYAKKCFFALVRLRGELSCAACDNTKEKFFSDPKKLAIKTDNAADLGYCIAFMNNFNKYRTLIADMMKLAKAMGVTAAQEWAKSNQKFYDNREWAFDEKCTGAAPAPATPAKKDDAKPATPAKKDDAKPAKKDDAKPATPRRT